MKMFLTSDEVFLPVIHLSDLEAADLLNRATHLQYARTYPSTGIEQEMAQWRCLAENLERIWPNVRCVPRGSIYMASQPLIFVLFFETDEEATLFRLRWL